MEYALFQSYVSGMRAQGGYPHAIPKGFDRSMLARAQQDRVAFWREREDLAQRCDALPEEYNRQLQIAALTRDHFGAYKALHWLAVSTLPLLDGVRERLAPESYARTKGLLEAQEERARSLEAELRGSPVSAVSTIFGFQSSPEYVLRTGRQNFRKMYFIHRREEGQFDPAGPRMTEVAESWEVEGGQVKLCVPIADGCPNACTHCDYGLYFRGNFTSDEITRMIHGNLSNNRGLPFSSSNQRTRVYYLGGGDPALNPAVLESVQQVQALYPGVFQVLSTVGNVGPHADSLLEASARMQDVGFQISVISLDEEVRRMFNHRLRVYSVPEAIGRLKRFHDLSGRDGYLALSLVDGVYDDTARIAEEVGRQVPREGIHISLQFLYKPQGSFQGRPAPLAAYEDLERRLRQEGYCVSISTISDDEKMDMSCGKREPGLLEALLRQGGRRGSTAQ